jgi:phosphoribosylformylglycinamidine cyclo-ligase
LPRAVADDLGVRVRTGSWTQPAIFETIARLAGIAGAELRQTFNCGIGFAVVLEEDAVDDATTLLAAHSIDAWRIGEVRPIDELGGQRYDEVA